MNYAKDLLTSYNKYTGYKLGDDPVSISTKLKTGEVLANEVHSTEIITSLDIDFSILLYKKQGSRILLTNSLKGYKKNQLL